jgi:CRP-like cAMP-binding protein
MLLPEELEELSFFRQLPAGYVHQVAPMAQLKECASETTLFRQGESSPFVYLVLEGDVLIEFRYADDKRLPVQAVRPGELVGWSRLLGPNSTTATARTQGRTRRAVLDAALAQRLYATRLRMLDAAMKH